MYIYIEGTYMTLFFSPSCLTGSVKFSRLVAHQVIQYMNHPTVKCTSVIKIALGYLGLGQDSNVP